MAKKSTVRRVSKEQAALQADEARMRAQAEVKPVDSRKAKMDALKERILLLGAELEKLEKEKKDTGKRTLRIIGTDGENIHSFFGLDKDEVDAWRKGFYRVLVQKLDYDVTLSVEVEYE